MISKPRFWKKHNELHIVTLKNCDPDILDHLFQKMCYSFNYTDQISTQKTDTGKYKVGTHLSLVTVLVLFTSSSLIHN